MHQERTFPGRVAATTLTSPDFAALARAFGGHGETVETTEAFAPAFERALASGRPAILHCKLDSQAITPTMTLHQISEAARPDDRRVGQECDRKCSSSWSPYLSRKQTAQQQLIPNNNYQ